MTLIAALILVDCVCLCFMFWLGAKAGVKVERRRSVGSREKEPGPLNTSKDLLLALVNPVLPASKHLDRVQDAVSTLLQEREVSAFALQRLELDRKWTNSQLSYLQATMSEEQMRALNSADKVIDFINWDDTTLASKVSVLARLVPELICPEFVAIVFRCDIVTAQKAVQLSTVGAIGIWTSDALVKEKTLQ